MALRAKIDAVLNDLTDTGEHKIFGYTDFPVYKYLFNNLKDTATEEHIRDALFTKFPALSVRDFKSKP